MRYTGNTIKNAAQRGWFLGPFHPKSNPLYSTAIELKWATHGKGDKKEVGPDKPGMTITILVKGEFKIVFPDKEFLLKRPGDFVLWGQGYAHGWKAVKQSLMFTVRWATLS